LSWPGCALGKALQQRARPARVGHLERALKLSLVHQGLNEMLIELHQQREEGEPVI
jgi:hypothetical protein